MTKPPHDTEDRRHDQRDALSPGDGSPKTEDYDALSPGELYLRHLRATHGYGDEDPVALFEAYRKRLRAVHAVADTPSEHPDSDERRMPWSAGDDESGSDAENTR